MRVPGLLVAVGAAVFVAACATSNAAKSDSASVAADVAAIGKIRDMYANAVKTGDANAIASMYTADGISQTNEQPTVSGQAGVLAAQQAQFGQMAISSMTLTPVKTDVSGDLGYDIGTYSFVGTTKPKGDTVKATGRYVVLFRKQADGSWKAIADMDNVTAPAAPPAPASAKGKKGA